MSRKKLLRVPFGKELGVVMGADAVAEASREHVGILEAMDAKRSELSGIKEDFKLEVDELGVKERRLRTMIQTGRKSQVVQCERVLNYETGMVEERRLDTGEVFNRRGLNEDEQQLFSAEILPERSTMEVEYEGGVKLLAAPIEPGKGKDVAAPVISIVDEALIDKAVGIIRETRRASMAMLQRRLRLSYVAAADVMQALESRGVVGPHVENSGREILIDLDATASAAQSGQDEESET